MATGTLKVGFPRDFDGFIVVQTCFGNVSRRDALAKHCTLSKPEESIISSTTYRVRPEGSPVRKVGWFEREPVDPEEYDPSKHNYCRLRSYYGNVRVGYVDEMGTFEDDMKKFGKRKECIIS